MHTLIVTVLAAALGALPAGAKVVERTLPATAGGLVEIDNVAGSIQVQAWDRNEVSIHAELGERLEALETSGPPDDIKIHVPYPSSVFGSSGSAELTVRMPATSRVKIKGVSAAIGVSGVKGAIVVESVSGGIHVEGDASSLSASTVSGDVDLHGKIGDVKAHTVSGGVRGGSATGSVDTETTSGAVELAGQNIASLNAHSVSGSVAFRGSLAAGASLSIESMSGSVELGLPAATAAQFEVTTFSGEIVNGFNDQAPSKGGYGPGRSLSFTTGNPSARIRLKSFSGSVKLSRD